VWWATDQPSYVSAHGDGNYGKCVGYTKVPGGVFCGGSFPSTSRLCRCDTPVQGTSTFGTGYSNGVITQTEMDIFQHVVSPGALMILGCVFLFCKDLECGMPRSNPYLAIAVTLSSVGSCTPVEFVSLAVDGST